MKPKTLSDIQAHALAEYPDESCGLVVVVRGKERYLRCVNKARTKGEHFIIDSGDYAFAEDMGEVVAVVHSHPDALARPSQGDRVACEASGLPWYVLSVMPGEDGPEPGDIASIAPEGYRAPLVGREWHHGTLDCYAIVRDWYAQERGITLPDFERPDEWWNDGHSSLYLDHFRDAGFEPVPDEAPLEVGDVILMEIRSKNHVPNHAAVYIGDGQIIQHMAGRLSSRDVWGGYWANCLRLVVRHGASTKGQSDRSAP